MPKRCDWARTDLSIAYHDTEWGVPVHDDGKLFEFLILEGAQAGLSWEIILNKRAGYRAAFSGFDPAKVARYGDRERERLLQDPRIVRNRLKIAAAIQNAKSFLAVREEFGSFDRIGVCRWCSQEEKTWAGRARLHCRIGCHEQRPGPSRLQVCRHDDLLCFHASCRHGQRSQS